MKAVRVRYFATFRETAGVGEEPWQTDAGTLAELYSELSLRHGFKLRTGELKAAVNLHLTDLSCQFSDGDEIVFIPPVAGG